MVYLFGEKVPVTLSLQFFLNKYETTQIYERRNSRNSWKMPVIGHTNACQSYI